MEPSKYVMRGPPAQDAASAGLRAACPSVQVSVALDRIGQSPVLKCPPLVGGAVACRVCVSVRLHVCLRVRVSASVCVSVRLRVYIYVCVSVCLSACVCLYDCMPRVR